MSQSNNIIYNLLTLHFGATSGSLYLIMSSCKINSISGSTRLPPLNNGVIKLVQPPQTGSGTTY